MATIRDQGSQDCAQGRRPHGLVRPVSQVELHFDRADRPTFEEVRTIALRWIARRAGRPLPPSAWDGHDFELEDVGAQRTAAVSLREPQYWTSRLDDADRNTPQRSWVTEIAIAETEAELIFGARLQSVTRGDDTPYMPSVPSFVKEVIRSWPHSAHLEGRPLGPTPWIVHEEHEVLALVGLLQSAQRRLNVIVCALPENSEDISDSIIDPTFLHNSVLGSAHVVVLTSPASFDLSDRVGREFSVFRGAVRSYLPGFDPVQDEPYRHPLALPMRIENWPAGGVEAFGHMLVESALRRSVAVADSAHRLPAFHEVRRRAAELRRKNAREAAAPDRDLLALAEGEIHYLKEEMRRQRELDEGLVETAEAERDQAIEERKAADAKELALLARLRALEERSRSQLSTQPDNLIPETLDAFEAWTVDNLSGSVELTNRALRGVKKSEYDIPKLIYRSLLLLRDYYVPMRREGGIERRAAFDAALSELGLECTPTISETRAGEEGDTYYIRTPSGRHLLSEHLKKGNSREPRLCFRCYFFWDETRQQVVVGWLPSHLDTRAS
jgi:hypothetical protein